MHAIERKLVELGLLAALSGCSGSESGAQGAPQGNSPIDGRVKQHFIATAALANRAAAQLKRENERLLNSDGGSHVSAHAP